MQTNGHDADGKSESETDPRVEAARERLGDKLNELKRRAHRAKEILTPASYLANPWVRLAIAAAAGFALGRLGRRSAGGGATGESILGGMLASVVRVGLTTAATAAASHFAKELAGGDRSDT
jgi:ElaB/YqjD/DUF883 family membrane-anchored ribosome-binding protein